MAYIRIPTGLKSVTATVSRKSFVLYKCPHCGQWVLHEYTVQRQAQGTYHSFQSDQNKERVENSASDKAAYYLEQKDAELFNGINVYHNYECVDFKVKCPYCNSLQPWSNIPRKWTKTPFCFILALIMLVGILMSMSMLSNDLAVGLSYLSGIVLLALIPIIYTIRRKKRIKAVQSSDASFVPPTYYNKYNINDLLNSPAASLLDGTGMRQNQ